MDELAMRYKIAERHVFAQANPGELYRKLREQMVGGIVESRVYSYSYLLSVHRHPFSYPGARLVERHFGNVHDSELSCAE